MQSARESKGMHKANGWRSESKWDTQSCGEAKRKQRDGGGDEGDGNDRNDNGHGMMMCTAG